MKSGRMSFSVFSDRVVATSPSKHFLFVYALPPSRPRSPLFLRRRGQVKQGKARQRNAWHLAGLRCYSLDRSRILSFFSFVRERSDHPEPDLFLSRSLSSLVLSIPGGRACTSSFLLCTLVGMYRPPISARLGRAH
jgi:hypothetical protein